MSVDVEDWFHVENLRHAVSRDTWHRQELRVERTMDRLLQLMGDRDVRATCFILGWVAERVPHLVQRIAEAGHEIASHGHRHDPVHELTPAEFRSDIQRSKHTLEELTNQPVLGYRAPGFSLTDWAIPILEDVGFKYDSSFFPTTIMRERYGKPMSLEKSGASIIRRGCFSEVPLSCLDLSGHALPWAGGTYFRLLPYPVFKSGVKRIMNSGKPYIFYIHPWELDATQPRVVGLRRSQRMRHYLNLEKTEPRLSSLLSDFRWITIAELLRAEDQARERGKRVQQEVAGDAQEECNRLARP